MPPMPTTTNDPSRSVPATGPDSPLHPVAKPAKRESVKTTLAAPRCTDRYQFQAWLGAGATAWVWRGTRQLFNGARQTVAIKVLKDCHYHHDLLKHRFCQEASLLLALDHPNLCRVYDFDVTIQGPALIMELVHGKTLADLPPDPDHALSYFEQALAAVAYLHRHNIVHRDLSAGNIMVTDTGDLKIMDLGLAKILGTPQSTQAFQGTAPYASPEALAGTPAHPSFDLYSLAAVFYHWLSGTPPYGYGTPQQILARQQHGSPDPLPDWVPPRLNALIAGLLRPMPQRLYPTVVQTRYYLAANDDVELTAYGDAELIACDDVELTASDDEKLTACDETTPFKPSTRFPTRYLVLCALLFPLGLLLASAHRPLPPPIDPSAGMAPESKPWLICPRNNLGPLRAAALMLARGSTNNGVTPQVCRAPAGAQPRERRVTHKPRPSKSEKTRPKRPAAKKPAAIDPEPAHVPASIPIYQDRNSMYPSSETL